MDVSRKGASTTSWKPLPLTSIPDEKQLSRKRIGCAARGSYTLTHSDDASFYTDIFLENKGEETSFKINNGQALCGPIYLSLDGINGKYLYLYNSSKDKYELIDMDNTEYLKLTTAGKYRLSNERTRGGREVIQYLAFGIALASLTSSIIYIVIKKKYWFW